MVTKKTSSVATANSVAITVPPVLVERFEKLNISNEDASALLVNFGVPLTEVGPILDTYKDIKVTSAEDTEQQALARETRLKLKKIRTGVENTRKALKEDYLRKGNAIQAVANYIREEIEPAEAYLQLQEDFIRVQEEKATAERIQVRSDILRELGAEPAIYSLGDMGTDAFESLVTGIKDANEAKEAREKAEAEATAKAEAERVAREQALAEENARLKAEADAREAALAQERAEAEAKLVVERTKAEALAKVAAEKEAQEAAERAAAAKAIADAEAAEKAAQKAAALAPDKDKLIAFADELATLVAERTPSVESYEAREIVTSMRAGLTNFVEILKQRAADL